MRPAGKVLEVSMIYGWGAPLFDGNERLRNHIEAYAITPFAAGLDKTRQVKTGRYDWHLADLSGGTHHQGPRNNTTAFAFGLQGSAEFRNAWTNAIVQQENSMGNLPPQTIELLRGMQQFNVRQRRPRVTTRDCRPGSDCAAIMEDSGREAVDNDSSVQPGSDR